MAVLKHGKMLVEVPTPGCYGIYPAPQGARVGAEPILTT